MNLISYEPLVGISPKLYLGALGTKMNRLDEVKGRITVRTDIVKTGTLGILKIQYFQ